MLWTENNSDIMMFLWMIIGFLGPLLVLASLYFVFVFINQKDVDYKTKLLWIILISPLVLFNHQNVKGFDLIICGGIENVNSIYNYYYYGFITVITLWILVYSVWQHQKAERSFKPQITLMTIGIEAFLFSFFTASFLASYLVSKGIIQDFGLENYGLFGMTFFIGMIAYMIVRFKAFDIKLIGAEALMISLIILIASEFFFIPLDNFSNIVLISITLLLAVFFGIILIHSVKKEDQRKAELQLMSDRLASANDQLRKLDNTKSEFISIASHQLRTPLTAIKGFLSLLMEDAYGPIEKKQKDVVEKVYTSNERLIALVEDLLNISRIESGRMEFKLEPWNIEKITQEVVDTFVLKAKNNNLYLETKFMEDPLPKLMIDGGKVREVISNFVDNALKYTPKGGVTVKISREGANARVTVSDTGIGIPATELPYLFSKFSRGKDTSRLNTGGTGLGLYVGKSMIEANGGKVWAESEGQGRGSRFIIELPIEQSKEILDRWG